MTDLKPMESTAFRGAAQVAAERQKTLTNIAQKNLIWHAHPGDTFTGPYGEKLVAVPVEPTHKMLLDAHAAVDTVLKGLQVGSVEVACWRAMLAAVREQVDD